MLLLSITWTTKWNFGIKSATWRETSANNGRIYECRTSGNVGLVGQTRFISLYFRQAKSRALSTVQFIFPKWRLTDLATRTSEQRQPLDESAAAKEKRELSFREWRLRFCDTLVTNVRRAWPLIIPDARKHGVRPAASSPFHVGERDRKTSYPSRKHPPYGGENSIAVKRTAGGETPVRPVSVITPWHLSTPPVYECICGRGG